MEGPGVNVTQTCQYDCRTIFYCQTVSGDYDEWQFCRDNDKFDLLTGVALLTMENTVNSAWYMKGKHLEYEMGSGFLDLSFNEISPE